MTCIILNYTWFDTVEKLFVLQIDRETEIKQAFTWCEIDTYYKYKVYSHLNSYQVTFWAQNS